MPLSDSAEARAEAVRILEGEFTELVTRFRRMIIDNAERLSPGMLPAAYKVLTTIARCDRVTVSLLAERMLADKGQISRMVRELESLGLIERSRDPGDARSHLLTLTAEGSRRLHAARQPQEGLLLETLQHWDIADITNLSRLLNALATGTRPTAAGPTP